MILDQKQEVSGCKALLLEIIRRAAYDWVLYRGSSSIRLRKIAEDAFTWLFTEEPGHHLWEERQKAGDHFTSFFSLCELLELDPDIVRDRVKQLTIKDILNVGRPPSYRKKPSAEAEEELSGHEDVADLGSQVKSRVDEIMEPLEERNQFARNWQDSPIRGRGFNWYDEE